MIQLPEKYLSEMKELFKEDYEDYLSSFEQKSFNGLRVNTSKISVEDFLKISPFQLQPVPWCKSGFYYNEQERPAKHPYYFAGLYYLQEPSAMLPAEVLPIEQNDIILDACAAPGGKATRLSCKLKGSGLLYANDVSASRCKALIRNLELSGSTNGIVLSEDIAKLEEYLPEHFDKILIDAPCSGEGMFRKDSSLISSWKEKDSSYYSPKQKEILRSAVKMLKEGGKLVYSTCTFSRSENEEVIEDVLSLFPDLHVLNIEKTDGMKNGISEHTEGACRLYPHSIKGEGHFVCLLQKGTKKETGTISCEYAPLSRIDFFKDCTKQFGHIENINGRIYSLPFKVDSQKLRFLRSGLLLGEMTKYGFEPSVSLALALRKEEYKKVIDFSADDERVIRYLKGETVKIAEYPLQGWVLICVDSFPLGFGKVLNGILKNKYPASYRYQ